MRLIDADALKKQMCDECFGGNCGNRCYEWVLMNNAPTVDAEPVVRCKDCKYYDAENHNCLDEMAYARIWNEDDYCSFAERREDEAD